MWLQAFSTMAFSNTVRALPDRQGLLTKSTPTDFQVARKKKLRMRVTIAARSWLEGSRAPVHCLT